MSADSRVEEHGDGDNVDNSQCVCGVDRTARAGIDMPDLLPHRDISCRFLAGLLSFSAFSPTETARSGEVLNDDLPILFFSFLPCSTSQFSPFTYLYIYTSTHICPLTLTLLDIPRSLNHHHHYHYHIRPYIL